MVRTLQCRRITKITREKKNNAESQNFHANKAKIVQRKNIVCPLSALYS